MTCDDTEHFARGWFELRWIHFKCSAFDLLSGAIGVGGPLLIIFGGGLLAIWAAKQFKENPRKSIATTLSIALFNPLNLFIGAGLSAAIILSTHTVKSVTGKLGIEPSSAWILLPTFVAAMVIFSWIGEKATDYLEKWGESGSKPQPPPAPQHFSDPSSVPSDVPKVRRPRSPRKSRNKDYRNEHQLP